MSLIDFRASRHLAAQPRFLSNWAQIGTREELQERFNKESLEVKRLQIGKLYELFIAELRHNLTALTSPLDDKAVHYLKEVEGIFAGELKRQQPLLEVIDALIAQIGSEQQSFRQGIARGSIAWLKIQNGLKASDEPLSIPERIALGGFYAIAVGAVGYMKTGMEEVERQHRVLQPPHSSQQRKIPRAGKAASNSGIWDGILVAGFTVEDLDKFLIDAGIIEDEESLAFIQSAGKGSWTGIVKALQEGGKMQIRSRQRIYAAIVSRYGEHVTSLSTMRGYDPTNEHSNMAYDAALELLDIK